MENNRKDFTGWDMRDHPEYDYLFKDGSVLDRFCFSHEEPGAVVFRSNLKVTFRDCNLMNCVIPSGCTVIGGNTQSFKVQNCLRDWFVDANGNPTALVNEKYYRLQGFSIDPADIPERFIRRELLPLIDYNAQVKSGDILKRFYVNPSIIEMMDYKTETGTQTYVAIEGEGPINDKLGNFYMINTVDNTAAKAG